MTTHLTDPNRGDSPSNVDPSENRQNQEQAMRQPVLFVGDHCILENHLTSSSLFFDFGNHPPTVAQQERIARCWNHYDKLLAILESIVEMNPELPMGMIEEAQSAIRDATQP